MSELEDKLGALLSNPDSMAQVMRLAQQLSGSLGGQESAQAQETPQETVPVPAPAAGGDGGLGSLLGGLDPAMIAKFLPLLQEYGKSNTQSMQLLYALQPYLKPERQDKIQRAAKLARLIHLGKLFLKEMGGLEHV